MVCTPVTGSCSSFSSAAAVVVVVGARDVGAGEVGAGEGFGVGPLFFVGSSVKGGDPLGLTNGEDPLDLSKPAAPVASELPFLEDPKDKNNNWLLKTLLVVMETIAEDRFLDAVSRKAGQFRQRLEGLVAAYPDVFSEVRGTGLMLGLACVKPNTDVVAAGYAQEVLTVPAADNVIRILPALTISDEEIAVAVTRLEATAEHLRAEAA